MRDASSHQEKKEREREGGKRKTKNTLQSLGFISGGNSEPQSWTQRKIKIAFIHAAEKLACIL